MALDVDLGLLDLVGLAATLMFAVPVGVHGATRLLSGSTLAGGFFLVVAALMVALPQYLPGKFVELAVDAVVPDDEE